LAVRHARADRERAVLAPDPAQLLDRLHVDEVAVRGEPELEEQEQLRAAAVEDGVVPVAREQLAGLLDFVCAMQLEGRERHAAGAAAGCASTSSAASTRSPTSTDAPRSASVLPSAASPTTG